MTNCSLKMQIRISVAAAVISAASLLSSCIVNDRTMGDNIVPDDFILKVQTKEFDLPLSNRISDSVQSINQTHIMVGDMYSPVFGSIKSSGASYILPYSDSTDFGVDPKLVKATLNLSIDSTFFTDPAFEGIHQRFHIYKLLAPLDSTIGYNDSMTPDKYSAETVTETEPVIYGDGTISIPLKESFARELLETTPEEFKDLDKFMKRIYGLYIVSDPVSGGSKEGGRLNFIQLGSSTIKLQYIMNDPDRDIKDLDTTELFSFAYTNAFNFFKTNSDHLINENPEKEIYIESLDGIKPHIDASEIKEMLDEWVNNANLADYLILLSRAELIFPFEMPADYTQVDNEYPNMIYAFTNKRGTINANPDSLYRYEPLDDVYYLSNIGKIDRSLKQYSLDITSYLQTLLKTDISDIDKSYDLWIAPMTSYTDSYTGNLSYNFNNMGYSKAVLNGPSAERKPKLKLTYGLMRR